MKPLGVKRVIGALFILGCVKFFIPSSNRYSFSTKKAFTITIILVMLYEQFALEPSRGTIMNLSLRLEESLMFDLTKGQFQSFFLSWK